MVSISAILRWNTLTLAVDIVMRAIHVVILVALAALTACDSSGPAVPTPAQIVMSDLPETIEVGQTIERISATVRDRDGQPVRDVTVEWLPGQGSVSAPTGTTNESGIVRTDWTVGTEAGDQTIEARVDGIQAQGGVTVEPGPLSQLVLEPASITLRAVGDSAALSVNGADDYGNQVSFPTVSWLYTDPDVARVRAGVVVARARGTTVITAQAGTASGSTNVVVDPELTGIRIEPELSAVVLDETVQLVARGIDARGTPLTDTLTATWSSSSATVATVDQEGRVTGKEEGTTTISAHAENHTAELEVKVRPGTRPLIAEIIPAALAPGDTAIIIGSDFSGTAAENHVAVDGREARVVGATTTELRVVVPTTGVPCSPTTDRAVVVTVDELAAFAQHPISGARQRGLAVGESITLHGDEVACNELPEGGEYMLSVFNTSDVPTARSGFMLSGTAPDAQAALALPRLQEQVRVPAPSIEHDHAAELHHWLLGENARLLRELALRTGRSRPVQPDVQARETAAVNVGATKTFRIPDLDSNGDLCNNFKTVTARATFVGDKAVIWEDQNAPLAGEMDGRWVETGQEYESVMHPIILEYFGDPQAYDQWLENKGKVHMLFSEHVNTFERGVNGFVFSGDLFPVSQCPQSNQAPMFYGRVPTVAGSGYDGDTAAAWAWGMRATIIHEVKHIVSYAVKLRLWQDGLSASPNYEEIWLEEATARLAEELYARTISGYGQGDNVTYQQSIWCERRVGDNWPQCDPVPNMVYKHFGAVYRYYRHVETLSPLGPAVTRDWTFYGSGWLLVRWALDHTQKSEQAFSRALVDEPATSGVENLAARADRSFPDILGNFSLAMAMDEHPSGAQQGTELKFPSWDTRDIMRGLHEDHQGTGLADIYPVPWPLSAREQAFGNFDTAVDRIQGGTATFFQLTGPAGQRQLLELLSPAGGTAAPNLGLGIVRVK